MLKVVHYTDPGCPYAFSAEPTRARLQWTFGDQLQWESVMIVLAEDPAQYDRKGLTPAMMAVGERRLQEQHGMPMDVSERPRLAATAAACLAVVATRRYEPTRADALLRALRVRAMSGGLLDDPAVVDGAAELVGLDVAQLREWMDDPATAEALAEDRRRARTPLPAALALDHKLSPSEDGGRRYSAPSIELHGGGRVEVAPGFQPWETYDALVANAAPDLHRRAKAEDVREVLDWSHWPLATAEVAGLLQAPLEEARSQLEAAGASFEPVGEDGYWSLAS